MASLKVLSGNSHLGIGASAYEFWGLVDTSPLTPELRMLWGGAYPLTHVILCHLTGPSKVLATLSSPAGSWEHTYCREQFPAVLLLEILKTQPNASKSALVRCAPRGTSLSFGE